MQTIKVLQAQTLNDIAITYYGDVKYATDICIANNYYLGIQLSVGVIVVLPNIDTSDVEKDIVKQIKNKKYEILTK